MIKKYFLNFWIWWYGTQLKRIFKRVLSLWTYMLMRTNLYPMITNFFVPMFQDQSFTGRSLSLFMRSFWIILGGILQIILTVPLAIYLFGWVLLPVVCIVQIVRFFV